MAGIQVGEDERMAFNSVVAFPVDSEIGFCLREVDRFGIPIAGEPGSELIGWI